MDRQRLATAFFNNISGILVTNAASYRANPLFNFTGGAVAPAELVSVFGTNIGPAPNSNDAVQVTFDGFPAPITYAGPNQINAIVPAAVTPGVNTNVRVLKNGMKPPVRSQESPSLNPAFLMFHPV